MKNRIMTIGEKKKNLKSQTGHDSSYTREEKGAKAK